MERKEFTQLIRSGRVQGVYLLDGPEENIKASALQALRKALLPEGMEDLNESVMDNPATDAVIAACETLPFLAEKRLVVVREHPALSGRSDADEKLLSYLAQVPESCVLVFLARGKADARKKLYTTIKKHGAVVTFAPLTDVELSQWIIRTFASLDRECPVQVASLLAFTVGTDTALLRMEIEKLAALATGREPAVITEADVHAAATRSLECTVFEMVDAVVAGKEGKAFGLLRDMLTTGSDRLGILAMLLRQFRLMQHIKIMQYEKVPAGTIKQKLGIAPFAAERCMRQAANYSGGEVRQAVDICLQTEYRVKSGQMNQEGSLEAAMLSLFAVRRARRG